MMSTAPALTEPLVREPLRGLLGRRIPSPSEGLPGTPSAVLVPLFERGGEVHVWFVRRPSRMRAHAGQVAFPGGKREPEDTTLLVTALREASEEVGFPPSAVDVLGVLDAYPTITGYVIAPFVGWIAGDLEPVPNAEEVDRVFSVPLRCFLEEPSYVAHVPTRSGYEVDGELIWGATAAVARDLGACMRLLLARATVGLDVPATGT